MRILVCEDEPELAALIRGALDRAGFATDAAADLARARDFLAVAQYDVVVLDLGLPDGDGLALLRQQRARGLAAAVLVLTARDGPEDRVAGLDAGADDYLVKPFHMPELIARLRALLRRPGAALGVALRLGNVMLDTATRQVEVGGLEAAFSPRETTLLEHLLRRQLKVVTREALEERLYSLDAPVGSNAIEVLVHRLRRKLAETNATLCVHTVRGVGYVLAETP